MTIHYHGTPISPVTAFYQLAGRHFCVSFAAPSDIKRAHDMGQSVMLDNGAFSVWKRKIMSDWPKYYVWCDQWFDYPTTWAVIPDVIDGTELEQDKLLKQWPHKNRGAPVWHLNESFGRLFRLIDNYPRICFGSTAMYAEVLSPDWIRRMDEAFDTISRHHTRLPWIHMLRGMQCVGRQWPFASVDSTDIARNHNLDHNVPWAMVDRWDPIQCPAKWEPPQKYGLELF